MNNNFRTLRVAILICLLLGSFAGLTHGQTQDPAAALRDYRSSHHLEKIYIAHDKPQYVPGDTIWCHMHLRDGVTHRVFDEEPLVHVDWIDPDGKTLVSQLLKIKKGHAPFEIPTFPEEEGGLYTLRAYTLHQRNFDPAYCFQKQLKLWTKEEIRELPEAGPIGDFSIKFFPEGGQLVQGLTSTIAFKAQNESGHNIALRGAIIDEQGRSITVVKTMHEGMGQFILQPKKGVRYYLLANYAGKEKKFELPTAVPAGYLLSANTAAAGKINIRIEASPEVAITGSKLVGHLRGQVFLSETLSGIQPVALSLPDTAIPSGLLHFTLFDPESRPVCERLVFNRNPTEETQVEIELDQDEYQPKKAVQLSVGLKTGREVKPAVYAITVYNRELLPDPGQTDIENYFLLQSDLKGRINNIRQYFANNSPKTRSLLDLLLLTHGWRRFTWQDVLADKSPAIVYPPEETISIAGKVTRQNKEKPVKADINLTALSENDFTTASLTTDEDGLFYFKGFDFSDTTDLLLQASVHKAPRKKKQQEEKIQLSGSRYVDIELIDLNEVTYDAGLSLHTDTIPVSEAEDFIRVAEQNRQIDSIYLPEWAIDLEEITVRARMSPGQIREQAIEKKYREKGLFYFNSTQKFLTNNPLYEQFNHYTIFDLIRTIVPRAKIIRRNGIQKVIYGRLSMNVEASIALDGRIVPLTTLTGIDPDHIAIIDVVTGFYASAAYGSDGPVIALVSKDPEVIRAEKPRPGLLSFQHPGYFQAREFYTPNYETIPLEKQKPDYRTTLYWQPVHSRDREIDRFQFYTGDLAAEYIIRIEGITEDGTPFTGSRTFQVTN